MVKKSDSVSDMDSTNYAKNLAFIGKILIIHEINFFFFFAIQIIF